MAVKYSNELKKVFENIANKILKVYPCQTITAQYFVLGILETPECMMYKILLQKLKQDSVDIIKETLYNQISADVLIDKDKSLPLEKSSFLSRLNEAFSKTINSIMMLSYIIETNEQINQLFKNYNITLEVLKNEIISLNKSNTPRKNKNEDNNNVELYLTNLNKKTSIESIIGNKEIYDSIFRQFLKKQNNNVILVGDNGIGKSSLVRNIANLLNDGKIPQGLKNKILMEVDFTNLISGMIYKGAFETRLKSIITDAKKSGKYIFFIDDIDSMINNSKYGDTDVENLLSSVVNENNIKLIMTCSHKSYFKLLSNYPNVLKKCVKVEMSEPDINECFNILNQLKEKYEHYHQVIYTDEIIKQIIKYSKRYFNTIKLPSSAIDLMDELGANMSFDDLPDEHIMDLEQQLNEVIFEKKIAQKDTVKKYDEIDILTKKEIHLKSLISLAKKANNINAEYKVIKENDVLKLLSSKTGIPMTQLNKDEKLNLQTLNKTLKNYVVGQDEAIEEVCKIVKRQRIGLSNPNKPSVLLFTGNTGTGKTYLAKKLAETVFGNEKYLIRLDMSEYADKMATAKLVGSSQGYIGYEDGSPLLNLIKKNKYCVLLLDEIEKADDSAFNIFLQIFDEGRLTDNKGETIDFKNVIIIMTSNVGAQEVSERNGGIGFNTDINKIINFEKSIFEKSIKKKFKPEFINRIDKIVYFNKLTDDNLKNIIKLEIDKFNQNLKETGYSLNKDIYKPITDIIMKDISKVSEYGARPINRKIQEVLVDKIVNYIINNEVKKGHSFKYQEIKKC